MAQAQQRLGSGENQVKVKKWSIIKLLSSATHHSREEPQGLQVLQDVAVLGSDQQHVESLQWLVHVADTLRLHEGVLLARVH